MKLTSETEMVHVNGKKVGGSDAVTKFTVYVSPYFVVSNGGAYTKHIYAANQRIASKLGNVDGFGADPRRVEMAGGKKYSDNQSGTIKARFEALNIDYSDGNGKKDDEDDVEAVKFSNIVRRLSGFGDRTLPHDGDQTRLRKMNPVDRAEIGTDSFWKKVVKEMDKKISDMDRYILILIVNLFLISDALGQIKENDFWEIDTASTTLLFHKKGETMSFKLKDKSYYNRKYWTDYYDKYSILKFDSDVDSIGSMLFYGCGNLREIYFPEKLKKIGDFAFEGCSEFDSIYIPDGTLEIGEGSFARCDNLSFIYLPNSIHKIGSGAFDRTSIKSVFIPKSTKIIDEALFLMCFDLEHVLLHDSVINIRDMAFYDCLSLKEIDIPKSVIWFGNSIFKGCKTLNTIRFHYVDMCMVHIEKDCFKGLDTSKITLIVPKGCKSLYNRVLNNEYFGCSFMIKEE